MKKSHKNALHLAAILAVSGIPAGVMAGTVSLSLNNYSYGSGGLAAGEISANNGQSLSQLESLGYSSYVLDVNNSPSFETFCVQSSVDAYVGTPYSYSTAQSTGVNSVQGNIALSEGAAFLYYEFATGSLTGYDYNTMNTPGDAAMRLSDAGELQSAIWYFMGETSSIPSGWPSPTSGDPFVSLAESVLGGLSDALDNNGAGGTDYNVSIMQLTDGNGNAIQNQLILGGNNSQSVPDGAWTVVLLGISLAGLFFIQYQRNKSVLSQD